MPRHLYLILQTVGSSREDIATVSTSLGIEGRSAFRLVSTIKHFLPVFPFILTHFPYLGYMSVS